MERILLWSSRRRLALVWWNGHMFVTTEKTPGVAERRSMGGRSQILDLAGWRTLKSLPASWAATANEASRVA